MVADGYARSSNVYSGRLATNLSARPTDATVSTSLSPALTRKPMAKATAQFLMSCTLAVVLTATSVLFSIGGASAQGIIRVQGPPMRQACLPDYMRYCRGIPLGGGRILRCLNGHVDQLSASLASRLSPYAVSPRPAPCVSAAATTSGCARACLSIETTPSPASWSRCRLCRRPAAMHSSVTGFSMTRSRHDPRPNSRRTQPRVRCAHEMN